MLARLRRQSDALLSYEQVARQLRLAERSERGVKPIPLAAIIGSVGRAADFTRDFLPRRAQDEQRWASVRAAFGDPNSQGIPPIDVYQVGEVYFVLDGNHRVSVARRAGMTYIDARVIEISSPVPLTPDMTPEDLICQAEYADFLQATGLNFALHDYSLDVALCGQYPKLLQQISAYQIFLNRTQAAELSLAQAAADWLEHVYTPVIQTIRAHDMLRWFPEHTETDLYLWVTEHQKELEQELGWAIAPDAAVTDLAARASEAARRRVTAPEFWRSARLTDRYLDHLFLSLLVGLSPSPASWNALEQAILIAQRERAPVYGLHIARSEKFQSSADGKELHERFHARLATANVAGELAIESGNVARKISERARLSDLSVLHLAHPPARSVTALTSGWRSLLQNVARPMLAVPGAPSHLKHALLLFDASPKSMQALFVVAYMAEMWNTALSVLTPRENAPGAADARAHARAYLELHEVNANYFSAGDTADAILDALNQSGADIVLVGSDSGALWQLRGQSPASFLLRTSLVPVLIC